MERLPKKSKKLSDNILVQREEKEFWTKPVETDSVFIDDQSKIEKIERGEPVKIDGWTKKDPSIHAPEKKTSDKKNMPTEKKKSFLSREFTFFKNAGMSKEKDYVIENLSMLLDSGMNIVAALDSITDEVRSQALKKSLSEIKNEVTAGSSLSKAVAKSKLFPDHVIYLIRIGEQTGRLSENLKIIADEEQKNRNFKSKVYSAIMYPVIVLSLALVIGVGVAWFILPKLAKVFVDLKIKLPFITKVLIAIGTFLGKYGIIVVPVFILLLALFIYMIFFYPKTKHFGERILFKIPGIGRLIQEIELARFGFILGTLLNAGIPVVEALKSLEEVSSFPFYRALYRELKKKVAEGNSFQKGFCDYPNCNQLIPKPIQQIITTGEQSGKLADTLIKIGKNYEERVEITTKNLAVIIEPVLLIIVWLVVAFIALAVIMPIYSLIGGFNIEQSQSVKSIAPPPAAAPVKSPASESAPSPEPTTKVQIETSSEKTLKILSTETGTLNVRSEPSSNAAVIAKVKPGETYEYKSVENGWYQIVLIDGRTGWVSEKYIEVVSE